jgi:uncharacterized membrane protein
MARAWYDPTTAHVRHHRPFYAALFVGVLVWLLAGVAAPPLHLALSGNTFFGAYLMLMVRMTRTFQASELRRRASFADEGNLLIIIITLAAIVLSFGSIFSLLNTAQRPDALQLGLLLLTVPLGWTTLHTIMAFHYAHLFYRREVSERNENAGGLKFPNSPDPGVWDFLYYSFVVGMTAQVSDVQVVSPEMRRITLAHGVVSFFFNTVILTLAVNVAVRASH